MRRTHAIPILSSRCEGVSCRTCPRPWRYFVTGMELWGHGDNATWLQAATEDYRRKPTEKLTRARWQRVARRWVGLGIPLLLLLLHGSALITRRGATVVKADTPRWATLPYGWILAGYFGFAALLGIMYGGYLFAAWWPVRRVRKVYIYPAARELAKITGSRFRRRTALAQIVIPPDFSEAPEEGTAPTPPRVYVPDVVLDDGMKKRIADRVGARLGLPDATPKWTEAGVECAYCDLMPASLPPADVTLEELMEALLAAPLERPIIGMSAGRITVHMDFLNDSPHTLGSAASGAGKSTLYKFIAMQRMRHGAFAIFLDFKKWSHLRWAGDPRLAGRVVIQDEIEGIHETLCKVLSELIYRKGFPREEEAKLAELRTIDVYVEEINTLMDLLVEYWKMYVSRRKQEARRAIRLAKDALDEAKAEGDELGVHEAKAKIEEAENELAEAMGLPVTSPALQALRFGVNLGREFRIHFHFIGQSIDARAAGGRNTRASFRTRMLARWDEADWKMLAKGIPFVRCPSGAVGIWAHVHGSEVEIVRVPRVDDKAAVEYVLAGPVPSISAFRDEPLPAVDASSRPAIPSAMILSELVEILPAKINGERVTLNALRHASKRDGFPLPIEGPTGVGGAKLYPVDHVLAWWCDREGLPAITVD